MEKSLFKITDEYIDLEQQLISNEGELTDELINALEINKDELNVKSEGYVGLINKLGSEVDYIDLEMKRLASLKKVRNNAIQRLKMSIQASMEIYGIEEIQLPLHKINFRKSESVEISIPVSDLPKQLQKIKIEAINKVEIKKLLKEGKTFKGVELVTNRNLQIR